MRCRVARDFRLESARHLPGLPAEHPCSRLHGHSFKVTVVVEGPIDPVKGWVMDFAEIDAVCAPVMAALDHAHLNTVSGLENPTSEHVAAYIWRQIQPSLPGLEEIVVAETEATRCIFRGEMDS